MPKRRLSFSEDPVPVIAVDTSPEAIYARMPAIASSTGLPQSLMSARAQREKEDSELRLMVAFLVLAVALAPTVASNYGYIYNLLKQMNDSVYDSLYAVPALLQHYFYRLLSSPDHPAQSSTLSCLF